MLRVQAPDWDALELLLRAVQPALSRYIRGLVGQPHADDATQEVCQSGVGRSELGTGSELRHLLLGVAIPP